MVDGRKWSSQEGRDCRGTSSKAELKYRSNVVVEGYVNITSKVIYQDTETLKIVFVVLVLWFLKCPGFLVSMILYISRKRQRWGQIQNITASKFGSLRVYHHNIIIY